MSCSGANAFSGVYYKQPRPSDRRDMSREEVSSRTKDQRYQQLMLQFRKIDISNVNEEANDDPLICGEDSSGSTGLTPDNQMDNDDSGCDWTSVKSASPGLNSSLPFITGPEEDDWSDFKPSVDIRTLNFSLEGILCPYCRSNMMGYQNMRLYPLLVKYSCPCGFQLESGKSSEGIKECMKGILGIHHERCPDRTPHYSMFKSNIVMTCNACGLFSNIS